jgi:hypothetical protein
MNETILDKIKKTVMETASQGAAKVEDAARIGKIRIDLLAEKARLRDKYANLGEKSFQAIQGASQASLSEDPNVVELVGAISENLQRIDALDAKLASVRQNPSDSCC